mmetsp:Transcript_14517/g.24600  ORF Transcript_14517/g.24600 Transcript_14517/m.24600 type:complete len:278 (+) Transcript_14517:64-897(+)|eukprot:CAMPEP_0198207888 /NCGR_PEP_ID=MMETSP1445-20131203/11301_1 /TAXON_ID=36898 /ORGANISM="Pyramimonas sp., Strain CCMP2087" /LENGTH=277 /DNA_ID=CAMNT_0043881065 /DNA_START=47 /DNA_END=880 /DNA_ORIENTATION=-
MRHPGQLLYGETHAHQRWFDSLWLFSGSPEDLGLNAGEFHIDYRTGKVFDPEAHGLDLEDLKLILLYNAMHKERALRCVAGAHNRTNLEDMHFAKGSEERAQGYDSSQPYERRADTTCFGDWSFAKGDQWTVVAFNRPKCRANCADLEGPEHNRVGVPQRSIFSGVFTTAWADKHNGADGAVDVVSRETSELTVALGQDEPNHHFTYGTEVSDPTAAFTASERTDSASAMQAGVWLSGHFPPLKSHFRLFHAASTKLLPAAVTAHQRDSMLDQICTH